MSTYLTPEQSIQVIDSFKAEVYFGLKTCEFENCVDREAEKAKNTRQVNSRWGFVERISTTGKK
jgi:hypothetical protein